MINDRQASELISKSLRQRLSAEEAQQMGEHIAHNENSEAFERISRVIQDSLADVGVLAESGDPTVSRGLPADALRRLRDSVTEAVAQRQPEDIDIHRTLDSRFGKNVQLAAALIDLQAITESQLADAMTDAPGLSGECLGDHLLSGGIVSSEDLRRARELLSQRMPVESENDEASSVSNRIDRDGESDEPSSGPLDPALLARLSSLLEAGRRESETDSESRHVVSRFTLIRKLGEGGLGKVWLARDEKLKRNVAIKEIDAAAAETPKAWQRFHREAEITGHLEHPNVVPLYQSGTDPKRGQPFYVMRFVGKRTLADAIVEYHERRQEGEEDQLDLHRLLGAFLDVCQAIAYAHSRGVVHRDVKPENVGLDNFGQVVVLDWGLAKLTDDGELTTRLTIGRGADDSTLMQTLAGEVIGTPLYMAPEQAAGDLNNVDELTDVYGLGSVLFAILTGCAPHEKSHPATAEKVNVRMVLDAIAHAETPLVHDYNPDVPSSLASICKKAMARKRYARHTSATELATEVERWMAGQNRKHQHYENLRIEGRELCANLQSSLRDQGTNTRFMSTLPPIQGIIDGRLGRTEEKESIWRERLTRIFRGLLQANLDYAAVTYCGVGEEEFQEIVRVERSSTDGVNIRNVPRSRLAKGPINETISRVMQQKPEDIAYTPGFPASEAALDNQRCIDCRVSASVPLFDEQSEEAFGFVSIECNLDRILDREIRQRIRYATEIMVIGCEQRVLVHEHRRHGRIRESTGQSAIELVPDAERLLDKLENQAECLDESNRELYGTRFKLSPDSPHLTFLLIQRPTQDG